MYLCLQLGEAGAFSPVACFAQLGGGTKNAIHSGSCIESVGG